MAKSLVSLLGLAALAIGFGLAAGGCGKKEDEIPPSAISNEPAKDPQGNIIKPQDMTMDSPKTVRKGKGGGAAGGP